MLISEELKNEINVLLDSSTDVEAQAVLDLLKEQKATRKQILAALAAEPFGPNPESLEELMDNPERGYEIWATFLQARGFATEDMPTKDEALALLKAKFTPDQIEILRNPNIFKKRKFIMIPVIPTDQPEPKKYEKNIMEEYKKKQISEEIIGWEVGIAEASSIPQPLPGEDMRASTHERLSWFNDSFGAKGIQITGSREYALLAAQASELGEPLDEYDASTESQTSTLLRGPYSFEKFCPVVQTLPSGEITWGDSLYYAIRPTIRLRPIVTVRTD